MAPGNGPADTILIVDDEEPVRRTFREWLEGGDLGCQILAAGGAEEALTLANQDPIDLAILDWNLGTGNDGLQLLEDLYLFNPDVVAIMVTGFAHQATPLDAMRMGVRDYLDKNQDLNRDSFLSAVRRQLERVRPAKRERRLHQSLVAFREALDKVVPLAQAAAALSDPVPLPRAIGSLLRFLVGTTHASDAFLLVRSYDPAHQPAESIRVHDRNGQPLAVELVPFARSVAGTAVSLQEARVMDRLDQLAASGLVDLQPFERGRHCLLAAPLAVGPGIQAVLELFDKQDPSGAVVAFDAADCRLVAAAADFGVEMLRQALAERQTHCVLLEAVAAALGASESVVESLGGTAAQRREQPPPVAVMDQLRQALAETANSPVDAEATLRLAEAIRVLALRHGLPAVRHCIRLVEDLRQLLDALTGTGESQS